MRMAIFDRMKRLGGIYALLTASVACAGGQSMGPAPAGLSDLPRLKNFSAHRVSSDNSFVGSNDDSKRIMPGETLVMADLRGPGVVSHIWITVADNEFAWPRLVRLRVYYDGHKTPSVDVPLGDFFGVGHGYEREVESQMVRVGSFGRARNSYWPMPFRQSCKITVTDEGNRPVTMFYYHVDWQKHDSLPEDVAYFHGYYRQERPAAPGKNYEFVSVKGTGHYVGTVLNVIQSQVGWFGEGDDLFYVDGVTHPQIYGTGTEDYINDAWGLRVAFGPWAGTPVAEGERVGARLTGFRWHVPDPIPFTKSLWAGIEHAGWTYNPDGSIRSGFEERPDFFSSAAFWYQKGINEDLPEPPYGEERLPLGNAIQIAVEDSLKQVTTERGKASVQLEVDWGRDLLFFQAEDRGSRINIPFDVPEKGRYEILARLAQEPDSGDYYALVDNKPTNLDIREALTSEIPSSGPEVFHNYLSEIFIAVERPLGWLELARGRHTLSFVCVGHDSRSSGYNLGINDVILERVPTSGNRRALSLAAAFGSNGPVYRGVPLSGYVQELNRTDGSSRADVLRALGSFGPDATPAAGAIAGALRDDSAEVRLAAAWALSQIGPRAAPAVKGLADTLRDPNSQVRCVSVLALRSMGAGAKEAVPKLIEALHDSQPFVRAPAADALGSIGPAAQAAVPELTTQLLVKGEVTYVLRSIAAALGEMGPAAESAIPALQEVMRTHRVAATAEEAILKITKKPVPSWF